MPKPNEIGPWLSKFALPSSAQIMTVTHEMAGDWLDYRSRPGTEHQRKLSKAKVAQYTEEMNAGRWRTTPQGLIFDTVGWMFNGQHRLQALRDSVLESLDFWVFPDEAADLFALVDTGAVRQARQLYNGRYASAVTTAPRYLRDGLIGIYATTMSPAAVLTAVEQWPELVTHAPAAQGMQQKLRIPAGPHLAVLAQAERTIHRDRILEWINGVTFGTDLSAGDPRLHIRERFVNQAGRREPEVNYNLIAKAWNLFARGERTQILTWRKVESTIPIIGYSPREGTVKRETTPEAQALLEQAAADYAQHNTIDPLKAADQKTGQVMGQLAAQRSANRTWGKPDEPAQGE